MSRQHFSTCHQRQPQDSCFNLRFSGWPLIRHINVNNVIVKESSIAFGNSFLKNILSKFRLQILEYFCNKAEKVAHFKLLKLHYLKFRDSIAWGLKNGWKILSVLGRLIYWKKLAFLIRSKNCMLRKTSILSRGIKWYRGSILDLDWPNWWNWKSELKRPLNIFFLKF